MTIPTSADQLVAELTPTGLAVDSYVIRHHDAIARVLNPARDARGEPLTWASLARDSFVPASNFQWRDLEGGLPSEAAMSPLTGGIDDRVARAALLGVLPLPASEEVFVGQWDGYADAEQPHSAQSVTFPPSRESWIWSVHVEELPRLDRLPMRWWHPDLHWVVGNDIYARSVFVSAEEHVIQSILTSPDLEAFRVNAGDPVGAEDF
ncbi:hypothetical protein [Microbacterium sp. HJ5]